MPTLASTTKASTYVNYFYGHSGDRVRKSTNGLTTFYPSPYFTQTSMGTTTTLVMVGNENVATIESGIPLWNHTDHLGSTVATTNLQGNTVEQTKYSAYGHQISRSTFQNTSQTEKYTGHTYDAETDLLYAQARYYRGSLGRFLSQDPEFWLISQDWLFDPQNQNSYTYARNNPIVLSDPTGRSSIGSLIQTIKNAWGNIWKNNTPTYQAPIPIQPAPNNPIQKTTTWDPITDRRISQLDPMVQQPATNFINNTESELNVQLRVVQGYRSVEEQNKLYAQGRTEPGNKVTNAKGGESYHNYGLAIDVVRMENGQPNWNKPITQDIANVGIQQGFSWGGSWSSFKDYPHFEMFFGQSIKSLIGSIKK